MKKKHLKHVLIIFIIVVFGGITGPLLGGYIFENDFKSWNPLLLLITVPYLTMIFNLVVRKNLFFKNYFISKYNLLSTKFRYEKTFDFSKELTFEKLKEVLADAGFKICKTELEKGIIFATSPISWKSWGENIYIDLKESDGRTEMKFYSVCIAQIYSWGKNEANCTKFLHEFEESLTV